MDKNNSIIDTPTDEQNGYSKGNYPTPEDTQAEAQPPQERKKRLTPKKKIGITVFLAVLLVFVASIVWMGTSPLSYYVTVNSVLHGNKTEVKIEADGTAINNYQYAGYKSLRVADIPSLVEYIGDYSFYGCEGLDTVNLPPELWHIGDYAFYNCRMDRLVLPDTIKSIGKGAFSNCSQLTEIVMPNNATDLSIGENIFEGCDSLTDVYCYSGWVIDYLSSSTENKSIQFHLISENAKTPDELFEIILFMAQNGEIENVTIPNGITSIPDDAFYGCLNLKSVTIPSSVTIIGERAFYGCGSLIEVNIPNSVIEIRDHAFFGCSSLERIYIPYDVFVIGEGILKSCDMLRDVYIEREAPTEAWHEDWDKGITANIHLSYKGEA